MSQWSPKASIIIPTYNRARYSPEAVESALSQTYPNIEVIVVNDGSTDDTEQVLTSYMKHICYIKQENGGCAAAKNRGLEVAEGEFFNLLDDDDRIHPEKIQRQIEAFQKKPNLGIVATAINLISEKGEITGCFIPPLIGPETQVLQILRRCLINQSSALFHRRCYEKLGGFRQDHSDDYDFWMRASLHYPIQILPEILTDYRLHPNQLTKKNHAHIRAESARLVGDLIQQTPINQIIPGICSYPEGYTLLGLILCEKKSYALAQTYFEYALPTPAGYFGLGLLKLHERKFEQAITHFEQARTPHSPFVSKVEEAFLLMERVQALQRKGDPNTSPEVVKLRKDLSQFHASVFRQLLLLARGESGQSLNPTHLSAASVEDESVSPNN